MHHIDGYRHSQDPPMPRAETLEALIARAAPDAIEIVSGDVRCCRIARIEDDSRQVGPETLFVARAGVAGDGAAYIDAAIRAGAVAILAVRGAATAEDPGDVVRLACDDPLGMGAVLAMELAGRPQSKLRIVGVTGTNGKTTIATLVRDLIAGSIGPCGLIGTVEIHDGRTAVPARLTTPGRLELAAILGRMVAAGSVAAAMEISSHALDQGRTADLDFSVAIFSNLTGDHLDYHGTMEAYAAAKARLFAGLSPEAHAIVNLDDPHAATMLTSCRARRIGLRRVEPAADAEAGDDPAPVDVVVRYRIDRIGGDEMTLTMLVDAAADRDAGLDGLDGLADLAGTVTVPLVGTHNAFNAVAAAVATRLLGADAAAVRAGLAELRAPRGRLEPVHDATDAVRVFVDYAHTDDAIRQVLAAVRPGVPAGAALVAVVGAGGDRDRTKRPRMLRAALDGADRVVVTSDNPRTEDPESIIDEVLTGARDDERSRIVRECDRATAIRRTIAEAAAGDVVVIAGKGHETYQIIGTERRPFDDVEVVREALADRRRRSA
jgi:UDP-N-acetylmuramoyl-L-alanyl-D-glutamate--2,6-diaminopimelate ligase